MQQRALWLLYLKYSIFRRDPWLPIEDKFVVPTQGDGLGVKNECERNIPNTSITYVTESASCCLGNRNVVIDHNVTALLYPDPNPVAKVPGDWLGPDMLKRGVFEAIKTDLLFGDGVLLELVAVGVGQNHLNEACGVSLLGVVKKQLACEAEVTAVAHAAQMGTLRPSLEMLAELALLLKRLEAFINLLVHLLQLPVEGWWPVIVIRSEESTRS